MRLAQARTTALHQAQVQQVHREQPQQRGLRIGQEAPFRWCIQRRDGGETSLSPCAPGTRPALQQVHVCLHGARAQQRNRVVRCRCQRVGSFRQRKRLVVLGAQAENEPEPVQEASPHRVLRHVAEQGMRPLQSAFRLGGGEATQMGERYSPKRCKRDLQGLALRPVRRLFDERQPALGQARALRRAQALERRFGSLGVVAQCGHRLAPAREVHGELGSRDRHARGPLPLERGANSAMQLGANERAGALVQHLPDERVSERIREVCRVASLSGTRGGEPQSLVGEPLACLFDP